MFMGVSGWTWGHIVALPALLLATALLPLGVLVFLFGLGLAMQPAWFRYISSNIRLLVTFPFKFIYWRLFKGQSTYEMSEMSDVVRSSYRKSWWGYNDPDDTDLGE